MLISQCHFDGPSRAHWPFAGPAEANGLPEAHGPPKVHGPRGHCNPPLGGPAPKIASPHCEFLATRVHGRAHLLLEP